MRTILFHHCITASNGEDVKYKCFTMFKYLHSEASSKAFSSCFAIETWIRNFTSPTLSSLSLFFSFVNLQRQIGSFWLSFTLPNILEVDIVFFASKHVVIKAIEQFTSKAGGAKFALVVYQKIYSSGIFSSIGGWSTLRARTSTKSWNWSEINSIKL